MTDIEIAKQTHMSIIAEKGININRKELLKEFEREMQNKGFTSLKSLRALKHALEVQLIELRERICYQLEKVIQ